MEQQQQFLKLFLNHEGPLKAYIGALVRDRQPRDEIFQEVALALCGSFERYNKEQSFSAWARGIARHKILKWWETQKREVALFSTESLDALDLAFENEEQSRVGSMDDALRYCVQKLPPRSQQILALRYDESLKLDEIAQKMDRTHSATHKALSRIRSGLKVCMQRRLANRSVS